MSQLLCTWLCYNKQEAQVCNNKIHGGVQGQSCGQGVKPQNAAKGLMSYEFDCTGLEDVQFSVM
jgi:hypothetical protein